MANPLKTPLSRKQYQQMRKLFLEGYSYKALVRMYNVPMHHIVDIFRGHAKMIDPITPEERKARPRLSYNLTPKDYQGIVLMAIHKKSAEEIAAKYNISPRTVFRILEGKSGQGYGFVPRTLRKILSAPRPTSLPEN